MSTITGKSIVDRASLLLQDVTNVRWGTTSDLLLWLNDGQREVVLLKPEACVSSAAILLTANATKQNIVTASSPKAIMLIDIVRNMGAAGTTDGDGIRLSSREILDAGIPNWHSATNTAGKIVHDVFDPRNPKTFYVFPKAPSSAWYVEAVFSSSPTDTDYASAVIGVDDIYANALLDYVMYRAYSKDADYAQNAQLAAAHYQAFVNSLGVAQSTAQARNPNILGGLTGNPNVPSATRQQ